MVGVLSRVKHLISGKTRLNIYNIHKPIYYLLKQCVWGAPKSHVESLQRIQNKVVMIVIDDQHNEPKDTSYLRLCVYSTLRNIKKSNKIQPKSKIQGHIARGSENIHINFVSHFLYICIAIAQMPLIFKTLIVSIAFLFVINHYNFRVTLVSLSHFWKITPFKQQL